ncbi:hypothetical protein D3P09_02635 [Paenibacillus pinisoli]|uniref:Type II secretion system protein GspF domain-containing protein n=1 Tax=Paenibacillus pinisoli TaxID=1276110 RepID=A0A3A6PGL7_9BACL|nr:hypothetical protein [Paenibacillus pinisoli]RJX40932.1 hypothetical protein D3P09_02635 [Paenibacillus pinisoli]
MLTTIIKTVIYITGVFSLLFLVREIYYIRRRSPPKLTQKFNEYVRSFQPWFKQKYQDPKLDTVINEAGLSAMSAWAYKFCRDAGFLLLIIILHVQFLFSGHYPLKGMIITAIAYIISLTGYNFMPTQVLLRMLGKERKSEKNDEIVMLYMLFSNDSYTETADHFQSVVSKLKEYRRYLNYLRPDVDQLVFDYSFEGGRAFESFGKRVGTKESKMLATILAKINQSNPETAVDLMEQHYETFLDFRRQRRKRKLRSNGYIGFTVVFLAIVAVLFAISSITGAYTNMLFTEVY